ncbi:MAG: hypothetical protein HDQ97_15015 [Lachnospiraceae bacterium]|nr:hypothetical protein [Lachnospiraceae bacterium]
MEIIETIFENYKASYNEETPQNEEQIVGFEAFNRILEKLFPSDSSENYQKQHQIFDSTVSYARASEKAGFVVGFKMAMNIMRECRE